HREEAVGRGADGAEAADVDQRVAPAQGPAGDLAVFDPGAVRGDLHVAAHVALADELDAVAARVEPRDRAVRAVRAELEGRRRGVGGVEGRRCLVVPEVRGGAVPDLAPVERDEVGAHQRARGGVAADVDAERGPRGAPRLHLAALVAAAVRADLYV